MGHNPTHITRVALLRPACQYSIPPSHHELQVVCCGTRIVSPCAVPCCDVTCCVVCRGVSQAPPGAGKTTTVPLALLAHQPSWLTQEHNTILVRCRSSSSSSSSSSCCC